MATKQAQMTREKTRKSFLKTDSMQTSTNTARNMASAVGTVITKATWSAMFWKRTEQKKKKIEHQKGEKKVRHVDGHFKREGNLSDD